MYETRIDTYLITGTGYKDDQTIDLAELDLTVEVEAEHFDADPSVGYMTGYWTTTKDKAHDEALKLLCKEDFDDFDFELELID